MLLKLALTGKLSAKSLQVVTGIALLASMLITVVDPQWSFTIAAKP
jgi:hypothetical protein